MIEEQFLTSPIMGDLKSLLPRTSATDNNKKPPNSTAQREGTTKPLPLGQVSVSTPHEPGIVADYELSFIENNSFILSPLQSNTIPIQRTPSRTMSNGSGAMDKPSSLLMMTSAGLTTTTPGPLLTTKSSGQQVLLNNGKTPAVPKPTIPTLKEQERMIDEAKRENFGLKLKIFYLEERVKKMTPRYMEEALNENIELKVKNESLTNEISTLKLMIKDNENIIHRLQTEKAETTQGFQTKYKAYEGQLEQLSARLRAFELELKDYEQTKEALRVAQVEKDQYTTKILEIESNLNVSRKDCIKLTENHETLLEKYNEIIEEKLHLLEQIEYLDVHVNDLKDQSNVKDAEISRLNETLDKKINNEHQSLLQDLQNKQNAMDESLQRLDKAQQQIADLHAQIEQITNASNKAQTDFKQQMLSLEASLLDYSKRETETETQLTLSEELGLGKDKEITSYKAQVSSLNEQLMGSEGELALYKDRLDQAEQELQTARLQSERLTEESSLLYKEKNSYTLNIRSLEETLLKGEKDWKKANNIIAQLVSEKEASASIIVGLENTVSEKTKFIESMIKGKTDVENLVSDFKVERSILEEEIKEKNGLIEKHSIYTEELKDKLNERDVQLHRSENTITDLKTECNKLEASLALKDADHKALVNDKLKLEQTIKHLELDVKDKSEFILNLNHDIERKEHDIHLLKESEHKLYAQVENLLESVKNKDEVLATDGSLMNSLNIELEHTNARVKTLEGERELLNSSYNHIEDELKLVRGEFETSQKETQTLKDLKRENLAKIQSLEHQIQSLRQDLGNTHSSFYNFELMNRELGDENLELRKELTECQTICNKLHSELAGLKDDYDALQTVVTSKEQHIKGLKENESNLYKKISNLELLELELESIQKEKQALFRELSQKAIETVELNEKILILKESLDEKTEYILKLKTISTKLETQVYEEKKALMDTQKSDSDAMIQLKTELLHCEEKLGKAGLKVETLEKTERQFKEEIRVLTGTNNSLQNELVGTKHSLALLETNLSDLESQLLLERAHMTEASNQISKLALSLKDLETKGLSDKSRYEHGISILESIKDQLGNQLAENNKKIALLESEVESVREEKEAFCIRLKENDKKLHLLKEKEIGIDAFENKDQYFNYKSGDLNKENHHEVRMGKSIRENQFLMSENSKLTEKLNEMTTAINEDLIEENKRLKEAMEANSQEIDHLTAENLDLLRKAEAAKIETNKTELRSSRNQSEFERTQSLYAQLKMDCGFIKEDYTKLKTELMVVNQQLLAKDNSLTEIASIVELVKTASHSDNKLNSLTHELGQGDRVENILALRKIYRHLLRCHHESKLKIAEYETHFEEMIKIVSHWPIHLVSNSMVHSKLELNHEWNGLLSLGYNLPALISKLKYIQGLSFIQTMEMVGFLKSIDAILYTQVLGQSENIFKSTLPPTSTTMPSRDEKWIAQQATLMTVMEDLPKLQSNIMNAARALSNVKSQFAEQMAQLFKTVEDNVRYTHSKLGYSLKRASHLSVMINKIKPHQTNDKGPHTTIMQLRNELGHEKGLNKDLSRRLEKIERSHVEEVVKLNHERSKLLQETLDLHSRLEATMKQLSTLEEGRPKLEEEGSPNAELLLAENAHLKKALESKHREIHESDQKLKAAGKNYQRLKGEYASQEIQLKKREILITKALKRLEKINQRREFLMQQLKSSHPFPPPIDAQSRRKHKYELVPILPGPKNSGDIRMNPITTTDMTNAIRDHKESKRLDLKNINLEIYSENKDNPLLSSFNLELENSCM